MYWHSICRNIGYIKLLVVNIDSIVSAIRTLIESPELRVKNAKMAFEQAQKYSWPQCAEKTLSFLSQILDDYKQNNPACKKHDLQ